MPENTRKKRNERLVDLRLRNMETIRLELGAGRSREGWTTIDLANADIRLDLTAEPIPFPDNSVDHIYSSHTFEHFTYPEPMRQILAECRRCLKPGGVFDICVPNARPYIEAYCAKAPFPYPADRLHLPALVTHTNGHIDIINYIAYMGGIHKYMFDEENLLNILRNAGFADVRLRGFNPETDHPWRDMESLYAVGVKPLQME